MSLEKCRLPGFLTFLFGKAPSFLLICLIQTFALYFHHYILFAASVSVSFLCFSPFSLSPINFYFLYLANTDTETPPSPSSGGRRSGPAKPSLRAHNHVSASSDWIHASERQIYAERANWTPWPRFLCNLDNLICSIWWRYPQQKLNILRRVRLSRTLASDRHRHRGGFIQVELCTTSLVAYTCEIRIPPLPFSKSHGTWSVHAAHSGDGGVRVDTCQGLICHLCAQM